MRSRNALLLFFAFSVCFQNSAKADDLSSMTIQELKTGIGGTTSRAIDFIRNPAAIRLETSVIFDQRDANEKRLIPISDDCSIVALPLLEASHSLVANKDHVYIVTSVDPYYSETNQSWTSVAIKAISAIHRPFSIAIVCENVNVSDSVSKLQKALGQSVSIMNYRDTF